MLRGIMWDKPSFFSRDQIVHREMINGSGRDRSVVSNEIKQINTSWAFLNPEHFLNISLVQQRGFASDMSSALFRLFSPFFFSLNIKMFT